MKIGELARRTGCSVQAIRYYESEQLLPSAQRSEGNFRLYDQSALQKVLFIKQCRSLDLSVAEIRHLLSVNGSPKTHCDDVNQMIDEHIKQVEQRMSELKELRGQLVELRSSCGDNRAVEECGILQSLSNTQEA